MDCQLSYIIPKKYKEEKQLGHGLGKFKEVFQYLLTLRLWDVRDRLRDTNILEKWREDYQVKKGTDSRMDFEIELHYRRDKNKRDEVSGEIVQLIKNAGGTVGKSVCIEDIAFHALKVAIPVDSIKEVVEFGWDSYDKPDYLPSLFDSQAIRYFRPIGQQIDTGKELPEHPLDRDMMPAEDKSPVLALLDGVPLLRHSLLDGRTKFYDPDEYNKSYEPSQQKHGTAMASLMCHGDLSRLEKENKSLSRPVYIRPVMRWHSESRDEKIPSDSFQEDIVERAVREMFDGETPVSPDIKVINLSLGNIDQHYLHEMSPWARLLDWLSFKYKILFIVSAGNYSDFIWLERSTDNLRQRLILGIDRNQRNHRLLSPAESMNALTVGALQGDSSGTWNNTTSFLDPIENMDMPSPYSRIGPGYRGAIKPEVFAHGGRLLYKTTPDDENCLSPVSSSNLPGMQVAYPGTRPEMLANTAYTHGTSNAAAIASHGAGHISEMLDEIKEEGFSPGFDAVLIKTLLVHSASQGKNGVEYESLKNSTSGRIKRYRSRYLGYGNINIERVLECTRTRATAIGYGNIKKSERHLFNFPLPESASIHAHIKLTVTLAWFSPINPFHIGMRRAKLFFEGDGLKGQEGHQRKETDWQQVRKGTIQHEIFELKKSNLPGSTLKIFVECAADAGDLDDEVPYGLAVTLEVAEQESIDLYQMIRTRIRQPVRPE